MESIPPLRGCDTTRPCAVWLWRRVPDTSAAQTTPYRNAHKNIKYVGDAACFECHREISESYRTHSMRRSFIRSERTSPRIKEPPRNACCLTGEGFNTRFKARR